MFRLMKLKPPHGWGAVAWELLIVTLGVLIALGAQQVAEEWQWRQRTDDARTALSREVTAITALQYERLVIQRCLLDRMAFLADRLQKTGPDWKAEPEQFIDAGRYLPNILPVAYRPPRHDLVDSVWENILNDDTLAHFSSRESADIAAVYAGARSTRQLVDKEQELFATLGPLARNLTLESGDRVRMLQTLYSLDGINGSLVFIGRKLIADAGQLDLPFDRAAILSSRKDYLQKQQGYRGACVEAVPLDIGFDGSAMGERAATVQ